MSAGGFARDAPMRARAVPKARPAGLVGRSALSWEAALSPAIPHILTWIIVIACIAAVTAVVAVTGGAPNPYVHLYYLPILYAAVRRGVPGAISAAVISGVATGPLMPMRTGGAQAAADWVVRLLLFVVVAGVAAWLARQQPRQLEVMIKDAVVGRALRQALRADQLHVHYQPIVNLADGTVEGVEALARWEGKDGRPVSPLTFIPVAERTGSIALLGAQVLEKASSQARDWAAERGGRVTVAVNVSAVQLSDPGFEAELRRAADESAAHGCGLCIEITETALMASPERARRTLEVARSLGVAVALDDFGVGHSSLAYLLTFPISAIKIDRSFVAALESDPKAALLVRAVHEMAQSLGAITVAEGIENAAQLAIVRDIGCDKAQGYFLGMPSRPASVDWRTRAVAASAATKGRRAALR